MNQRLLVITPVHNEAAHIERTARAMASQLRTPELWIETNGLDAGWA